MSELSYHSISWDTLAFYRFTTLVDKKRGVHDDIKYTWTNLKIARLVSLKHMDGSN